MTTVDLFSGCGGMSLGFQNSGFNIIRAYDNWDEAIKCYSENFEHEIIKKDLAETTLVSEELEGLEIDIIIGGPPCQDFSHAGKRKEGSKANLTKSFAEIVSKIQPEWYVMENVDRASKSDSYRVAKKILKKSGYGISEIILDASFCGVPQKRKRFFSIGKLKEKDGFLTKRLTEKQSAEPTTLRQYFGNKLAIEHYYRHPRNYNRRGIFSVDEPAPTMRGVNRPVPSGYLGHHGDPVPISSKVRALTTNEGALIQTFPKGFKWLGSKTTIEQMIGNAVPVGLAEFVASTIKEYLNKEWNSKTKENLATAS